MPHGWERPDVAAAYRNTRANHDHFNTRNRHFHDYMFSLYASEHIGKAKNVLDIGGGDLRFAYHWRRKNPSIRMHVVDLPAMVEGIQVTDPEIHVRSGSIENLPYHDDTFDVTYSSLVLHWVKDIEQACKEMYRVTKPGGICFSSIVNPKYFKMGVFLRWGDIDRRQEKKKGSLYQRLIYKYMQPDDYNNDMIYVSKDMLGGKGEADVMLSDLIGPVRYYKRNNEEYRDTFLTSGFSDVWQIDDSLFRWNYYDALQKQFPHHWGRYPQIPWFVHMGGRKPE